MPEAITAQVQEIVEVNAALLDFSGADIALIHQHQDTLRACTDQIVRAFYDRLFNVPETAAIFSEGAAERPKREATLRHWYVTTISANIDLNYWMWQWYIGLVHVRHGVRNPMMFAMMAAPVQETVLAHLVGVLGGDEGRRVYASFQKLTTIVTALIAEGYSLSVLEATERAADLEAQLLDFDLGAEIDTLMQRTRAAMEDEE